MADGLFLRLCTEMSKEYPEIEYENMIIDNCSMQVSITNILNLFDLLKL